MLIEFSVENYLSFKDLTTISMVAAKSFKEHKDSHNIETSNNLTLLKSAVIYGNNASGKSNLLEAMGFMKETVLNSFRDALRENNERKFPLEKFILNTKSEKETSFFEILFIQNGVKYRYGFEIDYDKIGSWHGLQLRRLAISNRNYFYLSFSALIIYFIFAANSTAIENAERFMTR